MSRNNQNFKRLCLALELTKHDVYDILNGEISKSRIDAWGRSKTAIKNATGNSRANTVSRYREMHDSEFDKFCDGLPSWMSKQDIDIE